MQELRKKILICGGAGFIGSNFIRHLYNKYPSYGLYNLDLLTYCGNRKNLSDIEILEEAKDGSERRYVFLYGDICDQELLCQLFSKYQFDMVVNFAAESHVDRSLCSSFNFIQANVTGVHNLIEACRKYYIPRFIQISTDEVYGDVKDGYSMECAPLNASNPYSASKASADILIKSYMRSHKLPAVIVRGSNNFGPYQYPEKLIPLVISNLVENKKIPVHGDGNHIRSWLHVFDFCNAIDLVMHHGRDNNIYNVAGTQKTNLEVIGAIHSSLRYTEPLESCKMHTNDRPGADLRYAPDATKIKDELGWAPMYEFDNTIDDIVRWYIENRSWWEEIKSKPVFIEHYKRQEEAKYY